MNWVYEVQEVELDGRHRAVADARVQVGAHVPPMRDLRKIEAERSTGQVRVERVGKMGVERQTK